jgi:membrane fusion protein (multidrug efflux system)
MKENELHMRKKIFYAVLVLLLVAGILAGIKTLQIRAMIAQGQQFVMPPEVVTSFSVQSGDWERSLQAIGSVDAVQGVTVTAELSGKVETIAFVSGSRVAAGDLLLQQDAAVEQAQLRSAQADAELARVDFERAKALIADQAISRAEHDNARAKLTAAQAQVENNQAVIARKTIRAPFAGRLGIRQVDLGQVINDGQPIVTLQALDNVFVNFSLPQQDLSLLQPGLAVRVTTDALPGVVFTGRITVTDPEVDRTTRNIRVQARLENPGEKLRAGMFVNIQVVLPETAAVLTIPITAVLYAPYSDSVFVIEEQPGEDGKPAGQAVKQKFVTLGEKRGDFVVVTSGLTAGENVVSTGVFKLRNGQGVVIDNKLAPEFNLNPKPAEG